MTSCDWQTKMDLTAWTRCSSQDTQQKDMGRTFLDSEPDLRHATLIIEESECNLNMKAVSTPREKLQDKAVLDGRKSPILKGDATRYRSASVRLS